MPPVPGAAGGADGKRGAGGRDQLGLFRFKIFPCSCNVYVKEASKADMASDESVCEKLKGGKGTDPGELYVYAADPAYFCATSMASFQEDPCTALTAACAALTTLVPGK